MAYYYPEGYFGPICDDGIGELELQRLQRSATTVEDDRVVVYDAKLPSDYQTPLGEPVLKLRKCKQRDDGTYYDCIDEWINPADAWDEYDRCLDPGGACYPWKETSVANLRLEQDFFVPNLSADSCSAFDPDINIRPTSFYKADGTLVTYNRKEKSSPVTYPVQSTTEFQIASSTITATWSGSDLVVNGTGQGLVRLDFEWNDNPNTYGTALNTFTIAGETFVQTGGERKGSSSEWIAVEAGEVYAGIISGGTGYGGFTVKESSTLLCFKDLDGNDCNAKLKIADTQSRSTISNVGYWSELGNAYGVWVNPAVCTLPQEEQEVTYIIPIEHTDTYAFQVGCDDNMQIFLNDESTPFMDVTGGIFAGGDYNTPYSETRQLTGGTKLKLVVRCTNSDAGFNTNGKPSGLAFDWSRNPGGWFIRICRGGGCVAGNAINWVRSGPDAGGDWGSFMDTYAVYPSNNQILGGTAHTATWNFDVPYSGNYVLEYGVDDDGVWVLDGTQILSSGYVPTSRTLALNDLSAGSHTMKCTVTNLTSPSEWDRNPGGIAWTIRPASESPGELDATFTSNGNIVTTGDGFARVVFLFEYDDNPNTYGKAIDSVRWLNFPSGHEGLSFTQHNDSDGSVQSTITMEAGKTHNIRLLGNTGGFTIQNNGKKICFRDRDGDDCNAYVRITSITQIIGPESEDNIIARSTDLNTAGGGNVIWTTRDATGYEYYVSS
jgi:hypothetical protein